MEHFEIRGEENFIKLTFESIYGFPDHTSGFGGYDVTLLVEIKSGNFRVNSRFYSSTGELYNFYEQLRECNADLKGVAGYSSYEDNLNFTVSYDNLGHATITGRFVENNLFDNKLEFEFLSDQSFLKYTVDQLEIIARKYGDNMGVKK